MWVSILMKILTSNAVETLIAMGLKYLVEHKTYGIGKELASSVIDSVAKSKANPTTDGMFKEALGALV